MRIDDFLGQCETQTAAGQGVLRVRTSLIEAFPNMRQVFWRNAGSRVRHRHVGTPALTSRCRRMFTVAPSWLNLRALESRLSRTCSIRAPSAGTHTRPDGASVRI